MEFLLLLVPLPSQEDLIEMSMHTTVSYWAGWTSALAFVDMYLLELFVVTENCDCQKKIKKPHQKQEPLFPWDNASFPRIVLLGLSSKGNIQIRRVDGLLVSGKETCWVSNIQWFMKLPGDY